MPYFLMEDTVIQEPMNVKVLKNKVRYQLVVQDADRKNKNGRIYPFNVLDKSLKEATERIQKRAFIGEMDHPIPSGSQVEDQIRQTTVLLKDSCHVMTEYEWRGNLIYGTFESLTGSRGPDCYGMVYDKLGIGVSMRGLAELDRRNDCNMVLDPLYIICYDLVSNPSHAASIIDEKLVTYESIKHMFYKDTITESANGNMICMGDHCYLANYFDKLVEQKTFGFFKAWV